MYVSDCPELFGCVTEFASERLSRWKDFQYTAEKENYLRVLAELKERNILIDIIEALLSFFPLEEILSGILDIYTALCKGFL